MRLFILFFLSFLISESCFSQAFTFHESGDSVNENLISKKVIVFNYRMIPYSASYENRYRILKNYNDYYPNFENNYSLQNFISENNYNDSSILAGFRLVNENYGIPSPGNAVTEKELFYGAWRNRLTAGKSGTDLRNSMIEGTESLISLGYTDFGNDFLPFITSLMEEQHIVNYDNSRTKAFGKGSKGIVTSLQILNALNSQNTELNFGVCRDVHEMGRELLKSMSEAWYGHFYPGMKIDFDEYIFLQSWTTNKSQHVTISMIDPIKERRIYELDWGRVIVRENMPGYDNGRMYGNTYRIWKYDSRKQMSVPVDFRRTAFGKILDENVLSRSDYFQFNGIFDEEFYSDISYLKNMGKYGELNFSLGTYYPGQMYFLTGWRLNTKKKKITSFLSHSSLFALQGVIHEDTRKKQLLYPQTGWQFTGSIMGLPRILSRFETSKFKIAPNLTLDAYVNQQFDVFLTGNLFYMNDSIDDRDISGSGDGNLSFSNGFNIVYQRQRIRSAISLQSRSCLLPKDIRLFSPNIFTLIPNLRYITPAVDAIATTSVNINEHNRLSAEGIFEFTNLHSTIFSGSVSIQNKQRKNIHLSGSAGLTHQIRGLKYFWYPATRKWVEMSLNYFTNSFSVSIMSYSESSLSCNISYRRAL